MSHHARDLNGASVPVRHVMVVYNGLHELVEEVE